MYGFPGFRVPKVRCDVRQGCQYKATFGDEGVGNPEFGPVLHQSVIEQDINIDAPEAPFFLPDPAKPAFDVLYTVKEIIRSPHRLQLQRLVQMVG